MAKRNPIDGLLDRFERLVAEKGPEVGEVLVAGMRRHLVKLGGPISTSTGKAAGGAKRGPKPKGPSETAQAMGQEKFTSSELADRPSGRPEDQLRPDSVT